MSPYAVGNRGEEPNMIAESRKALIAAFVAFLAPISVLLATTNQELNWRVFAGSVVAGLIAGGTTWLVRNGSAPEPPAE